MCSSGVVVVPGAMGGHILGGVIPRCLGLRIKGLLGMLIVCTALGIIIFPLFMLTCDMPDIAGINVNYFNT